MQLFQKQPDADHVAALERMRKAKECHCGHAPGREVVARRNVQGGLPAERHHHHESEYQDQESPGEVAGGEIEPVKTFPDHKSTSLFTATLWAGRRAYRMAMVSRQCTPRASQFRQIARIGPRAAHWLHGQRVTNLAIAPAQPLAFGCNQNCLLLAWRSRGDENYQATVLIRPASVTLDGACTTV